jgi:hypothetical protein
MKSRSCIVIFCGVVLLQLGNDAVMMLMLAVGVVMSKTIPPGPSGSGERKQQAKQKYQ